MLAFWHGGLWQGPNFGVASACAAGSHAIGEALRFLQNGEADMMLTGEQANKSFIINITGSIMTIIVN